MCCTMAAGLAEVRCIRKGFASVSVSVLVHVHDPSPFNFVKQVWACFFGRAAETVSQSLFRNS